MRMPWNNNIHCRRSKIPKIGPLKPSHVFWLYLVLHLHGQPPQKPEYLVFRNKGIDGISLITKLNISAADTMLGVALSVKPINAFRHKFWLYKQEKSFCLHRCNVSGKEVKFCTTKVFIKGAVLVYCWQPPFCKRRNYRGQIHGYPQH